MRGLKLALGALSKHLWRTILTVLFFSLALGTLSFVLSCVMYDAPHHYLGILAKNDVTALVVEAGVSDNAEEVIRKYIPENQGIFEIHEWSSGGSGIELKDDNFRHAVSCVCGLESEDFEEMGYELEHGDYPRRGEYAISSALFRRLQKEGLTQVYDESGKTETRTFSTFEELQALLKLRRSYDPIGLHLESYWLNPVILSGVVDTKFDEARVAELEAAVDSAAETDRAKAQYNLELYINRYCYLFVFSGDETIQTNKHSGLYLTSFPKESKDRKAMFLSLQSDLRARISADLFHNTDKYDEIETITIEEEHYFKEFVDVVSNGYGFVLFVLPFSILFFIITFFMMLNLASKCGKTSADAIEIEVEKGMKKSEIYGVSLLRSLIVALISFIVSIGFAYFCRALFTTNGIIDNILKQVIEGWDSADRNMGDFYYFAFLPFFVSLLSGIAVSVLVSPLGYRKSRLKAETEEDEELSDET